MAGKLEKEIEELLQKGKAKLKSGKCLETTKSGSRFFFISKTALCRGTEKNQVINLFLALVLLFITAKKLITAFSFGVLNIFLLLSLVAQVINIYVLREILCFHRIGYPFLFVLSAAAGKSS